MVSKGLPILQTKPPAHKGASRPQPSQRKPTEIRAVPGVAPGQAGPICYRCGQPGHIQSDCPQLPERPHAAAARVEGKDKEKAATHAAVNVGPQEEEVPPADAERESLLHQSDGPGEVVGDWEPAGSQYDWDEEGNEEENTSYRAYEVGSPESGYLKLMRIAEMWYVTPTPGPVSERQPSRNHCPPPKVVQDTSSV